MTEEKIEHDLATGLEDDLDITDIARRLAPRGFDTPPPTDRLLAAADRAGPPKKRMMTPAEHMAESLGALNKAFDDTQALYVKLLGESGSLGLPTGIKPPTETKKPVVMHMHDQADEVASKASDIAALIAQIRDRL